MTVYLICKQDDDTKDSFVSFHTNKKIANLAIRLYDDMYIEKTYMTESEYAEFNNLYEHKKLTVYKNNHVGCMIIRKCDADQIINTLHGIQEIINDNTK